MAQLLIVSFPALSLADARSEWRNHRAARAGLVRSGEQRHTRYEIAIPLRHVLPVAIDEDGNLKSSMDCSRRAS
jgi:hypothetical protein